MSSKIKIYHSGKGRPITADISTPGLTQVVAEKLAARSFGRRKNAWDIYNVALAHTCPDNCQIWCATIKTVYKTGRPGKIAKIWFLMPAKWAQKKEARNG